MERRTHDGQRREGGQPRGERRRRRLVDPPPVGAGRVELAVEVERRTTRECHRAERRHIAHEWRHVARRRRLREAAPLRVVEEEARKLLTRGLKVVVVGLSGAQLVHATPLLLESLLQRLHLAGLQLRRCGVEVLQRQRRTHLLGLPHRALELLQLRLDAAQPLGCLLEGHLRLGLGLGLG